MAVEKFPIEAGHIMMFARSVGDANRIYYRVNDERTLRLIEMMREVFCSAKN